MKNLMTDDQALPELEETTGLHFRSGPSEGEKEAFDALSSFALPLEPLELVEIPKPINTRIVLEVHGESAVNRRKGGAHQLHWFDVIALFTMLALAGVKFGLYLHPTWT